MILFELFQWIHPTRGSDTDMCVASFWSRSFFLRWITADPSPWGNFTPPMTKDLVWRDPGGSWARFRPVSDYNWIHPSWDCSWQTYICMRCLCETGRFSYGESPRTPPLEGTSLHRRNNSVERPWGILSLFTTCSDYVSVFPESVGDTDIYMYVMSLWSRSFFLRWITADPSPWGNFTPPTKQ